MQQDNSLNWIYWASAIIVFVLIAIMYYYRVQIQNFLDSLLIIKQNIQFILSHIFIVLVILAVLALVSYIVFIIIQAVYREIVNIQDEKELLKNEASEIENIFDQIVPIEKNYVTNEIEKLNKKLSICRQYKKLNKYILKLKKRKAKAVELLEQINRNEYKDNLDKAIDQRHNEIENLDKEIRVKELAKEDEEELILWKLNTEENPVFLKDNLNSKEINALIKGGYYSVSEYCMINNKLDNFLVKPKLNHSPTHAFLVWNAKKLLEKIKGVDEIKESLTKDADITFKFNNKIYALEIEKGDLLYKKNQLYEKVNYLNKKYPKRWMFIVSHRDLASKYGKFGFTSQRKEVSENLSKLLNIAHPI